MIQNAHCRSSDGCRLQKQHKNKKTDDDEDKEVQPDTVVVVAALLLSVKEERGPESDFSGAKHKNYNVFWTAIIYIYNSLRFAK